jgi:hypothetical protein
MCQRECGEAIGIWRELATANPEAFQSLLATFLNNQSRSLADLGRNEEALVAAQEALTIHRALAAVRPDEFRSELVVSLRHVGHLLETLGSKAESTAVLAEADELADNTLS